MAQERVPRARSRADRIRTAGAGAAVGVATFLVLLAPLAAYWAAEAADASPGVDYGVSQYDSDWYEVFGGRGNPLNKVLWDHGRVRRTSAVAMIDASSAQDGDEYRMFRISSSWVIADAYISYGPNTYTPLKTLPLASISLDLLHTDGKPVFTTNFQPFFFGGHNASSPGTNHGRYHCIRGRNEPGYGFPQTNYIPTVWRPHNTINWTVWQMLGGPDEFQAYQKDPLREYDVVLTIDSVGAGTEDSYVAVELWYLAGD